MEFSRWPDSEQVRLHRELQFVDEVCGQEAPDHPLPTDEGACADSPAPPGRRAARPARPRRTRAGPAPPRPRRRRGSRVQHHPQQVGPEVGADVGPVGPVRGATEDGRVDARASVPGSAPGRPPRRRSRRRARRGGSGSRRSRPPRRGRRGAGTAPRSSCGVMRTSTTTRPRTLPARMSAHVEATSPRPMMVVIASSRSGSRSVASRLQASTRAAWGALTESTPDQADAAEDERQHGGGQVVALRQPARGDHPAIAGGGQDVGQGLAADGVDGTGPAFGLQRPRVGLAQLGPVDQFGRTEPAQVALLLRPAGGGHDPVAELGQHGDGDGARRLRPRRSRRCRRRRGGRRCARGRARTAWRCSRPCRWPWPPGARSRWGGGPASRP